MLSDLQTTSSLMVCSEIVRGVHPIGRVDTVLYARLHPEGKRLITGWFARALAAHTSSRGDLFEGFIFAWIAMNAWGACVTSEDVDRRYIVALASDPELGVEFNRLCIEHNDFRESTIAFAELWPIFKVTELRELGLLHGWPGGSRADQVKYYLSGNASKVAPECWLRHSGSGEHPLNWAHSLSAIYRVRCNLFHGEKAAHSEMDRKIVAAALGVLVGFIRYSAILE